MYFYKTLRHLVLVCNLVLMAQTSQGQTRDVAFAGVAFSGDAAGISQRFPYSLQYDKQLKATNSSLFKRTYEYIAANNPKNFNISTAPLDQLKGNDQALVASLVISSETVSVEHFGNIRKLFVLLRGQALFFDFKSMSVVRAYPVSFGYVDNFRHDPSAEEILERVRLVYEGGNNKPGLYSRYASAVAAASLPTQIPRYVQVTKATLAPEMTAVLPAYLKSSPGIAETWAADLVAEAISTRVGVPIVPYSKGYAVGNVMSMQVMDGDVFNLTLPKPDYEIEVDFKNTKKIKFSESAGGASFVYGTYADIRIHEPLSGTEYLKTSLKNGETKVIPASQTYVDDFPAYYDSVNGMFVKLAETIAGNDSGWIKKSASAPDIDAQIAKTTKLMNLCK
ncbi:MAG: hypothetical protein RR749_07960 [Comamonas sp.]